jgi:predicted nucleic acid-binding protein
MASALLDTNILLDVLLDREPWVKEAAELWRACDQGRLRGFVSAVSLTNVFDIGRKLRGKERAHEAVGHCLKAVAVAAVDGHTLGAAWRMLGSDFEDNVQVACASASGIDFIVTRDPDGFRNSPVVVMTPQEMLARLAPA